MDHKTQVVRIPPDLLMNAIAKAPRSYTMASRGKQCLDLYLDGNKTYGGTDGNGTTTVDRIIPLHEIQAVGTNDDIIENGLKGQFITSSYTSKNFRKLWTDSVTKKWSREKRDFLSPQDAAIKAAKSILQNHQSRPLDPLVEKEIQNIMTAAEKELISC